MRRSILVLLASIFVLSSVQANALKIGTLDFQKVVAESPMAKKMNKAIEDKFKPRQQELLGIQKKLEEKATELQRNDAVMKDSQKEKLRNEIISLRNDLEKKGQEFQADLQKEQAESSQKFTTEVEKQIKKIGDKDKFDMVFQRQAIAYLPKDKEIDITDKLINVLK